MNLTVKNSIGEQFNIDVVRYFRFNGINYLMFTKNEVDEAGYQKLYISKIINMVGNNIDDEIEWNLVRDTIKVIAKANKDNTALPIEDLNEAEINGIQIIGQKPFKLTASSVVLLGANKKVEPAVPNLNNSVPTIETVVNEIPSVEDVVIPSVQATPIEMEATPAAPVQPVFPSEEPAINPVIPSVDAYMNIEQVNPVEQIVPSVENNIISEPVTQPINNETPQPYNFSAPSPTIETIDYKKLYEEQTLKLNALTVELEKYKELVDQLKNILK